MSAVFLDGRNPAVIILLMVLLTGFLACSGDDVAGIEEPDSAVTAIELDYETIQFGAIGSFAGVTAAAMNASGAKVESATIEWSSSDGAVASVAATEDPNGSTATIRSQGNGVSTIEARVGEANATLEVRVYQIVDDVSISVSTNELARVGESVSLKVALADSNDVPLHPSVSAGRAEFTSADPSIVGVDGQGNVTARWMGSTDVIVATPGVTEKLPMTVSLDHPELGSPIVGEAAPCAGGMAGPFPCAGLDLLSFLPLAALGVPEGDGVFDVWGWKDEAEGRLYVAMSGAYGVYFAEVTNPLQPRALGYLPGDLPDLSLWWRDMKVHQNHLYIVTDINRDHGIQIFDLTRLRNVDDFTVFSDDGRYHGVSGAHNLAINEETGFAYAVGSLYGPESCGGGLHMIDLASPKAPDFAGCFAEPATGMTMTGYVHDVQCVVYAGTDPDYLGREICFGSNENAIAVTDVTDKSDPVTLSTATYPDLGYVHQGWLSEDQRYFFQNDELDERDGLAPSTRLLVWDVSDLEDPILVHEHYGPSAAIDHNLYVRGNRLYQSNYTFGVRLLDVTDPFSPLELGYLDTHPADDQQIFSGSWSNYPFFGESWFVVTSIGEGLFILRGAG